MPLREGHGEDTVAQHVGSTACDAAATSTRQHHLDGTVAAIEPHGGSSLQGRGRRALNTRHPLGALDPTAASLLVTRRAELDVEHARSRQLVRLQRRWPRRRGEAPAGAARGGNAGVEDWAPGEGGETGGLGSRRRAAVAAARAGETLVVAETSLREAGWELDRERMFRKRLEKVSDEPAAEVQLVRISFASSVTSRLQPPRPRAGKSIGEGQRLEVDAVDSSTAAAASRSCTPPASHPGYI
ncbi:hypothetical protein EJB05_18222 [Eragrostis curvula]|uniref:Uncharacterized protein n=1 Tax=Eragrostis curvula TaxID=38414 RepID=A0A5J9VIU7_9POAL|nr:hypothetical protein EJB05_18222 [Eragrostis curvula]